MGSSLCDAFAVPGDLAVRWRPLSPAEAQQAETLLSDASRIVRRKVPGLDASIAAGARDREDATIVVCSMVRRAMTAGFGGDGVSQQSQTVGPFQLAQTYTNPQGNLYVGKDDLALLGGRRRGAFSVNLSPGGLT